MGMVTGYLAAISLYVLLGRNSVAARQTLVVRVGLRKWVWTSKELERKRERINCSYIYILYFCVVHGPYIVSRGRPRPL